MVRINKFSKVAGSIQSQYIKILKIEQNHERPPNSQGNLKAGGIMLSDFKPYYKSYNNQNIIVLTGTKMDTQINETE